MKLKDLLDQCDAGVFSDPEDEPGDPGAVVVAMVYLPQRAESSREEFAGGFRLQYGTLHGWGEYELSIWAPAAAVDAAQWRRFILAVEQAGGSVDMDERSLEA